MGSSEPLICVLVESRNVAAKYQISSSIRLSLMKASCTSPLMASTSMSGTKGALWMASLLAFSVDSRGRGRCNGDDALVEQVMPLSFQALVEISPSQGLTTRAALTLAPELLEHSKSLSYILCRVLFTLS